MIRTFLKFSVLSLVIVLAGSGVVALDVEHFAVVMMVALGGLFVLPALLSRWIAPRSRGLRLAAVFLGGGCTIAVFCVDNAWLGRIADAAPELLREAPLTAAYRPAGWRIAREFALDTPMTVARGRHVGTYWIAPLLAPGWKRGDPVIAWVAASTYLSGKVGRLPLSDWDRPGEVVRFTRFTPHWRLARRAAGQHGLNLPEDIALFAWRPDAAQAMHEQAMQLLTLLGAINGTWLLCVLAAAWRRKTV
ncbi:hypothetical protein [Tahibacter harae]|uniref:Transmembrane protein n=1 Tax=Tahibacter harae TaxID=2963937 RepID=A0ABT1QLD7_9GAMM|nr:hypothetical protein [Tahibacter harae]MCQ4163272.1 hypothetical protein [Tahibacter harae]